MTRKSRKFCAAMLQAHFLAAITIAYNPAFDPVCLSAVASSHPGEAPPQTREHP
jgi:hypothetical protein